MTVITQGLTDDATGLGRFRHHPDPAIDFCLQVETLESRLHQAMNSLCKPGDEPEAVENVLVAIEQAMGFRVGGDEGAVNAKAVLRDLEKQARAALVPAPAVPDDVAQMDRVFIGGGEYVRWSAAVAAVQAANARAEAQAAELARVRSGIYVASKAKYGPEWIAMRQKGYPVKSTWIDECGYGATSDWSELWTRCVTEASTAIAVVVIEREGDEPRGALVEVGAALAAGVPVFAAGVSKGTWHNHPGVTVFETEKDAFRAASARHCFAGKWKFSAGIEAALTDTKEDRP